MDKPDTGLPTWLLVNVFSFSFENLWLKKKEQLTIDGSDQHFSHVGQVFQICLDTCIEV